jgi:hypothetical protein
MKEDQHHFITMSSLNDLHLENLDRDVSMTTILKVVCKRQSYTKTEVECLNVLPLVGRILHLLMGPRFRLLYHDPHFLELKEDVAFTSKKTQVWHLLLWSILSNKPAMSHFFVLQSSAPLGAALVAFMLYSRLANWANDGYEEELRCSLDKAADHFQKLAIKMVEQMYERDVPSAYRILICELPFDLGPYVTPLVIADDAQAMDFLSQGCCQTFLQRVWKGNMSVDTPFWKSFPIFSLLPFLVIPWIHFYNSSLKPSQSSMPQSPRASMPRGRMTTTCCVQKKSCVQLHRICCSTLHHLVDYITAPVTKFYSNMLSYTFFLGLLSYFVLTELRPFRHLSLITVSEWVLVIWIISHLVEELVQVFGQRDTGPLYDLPDDCMHVSIWHRTEKLKAHLYPIRTYLRGGRWNSIDMTIVALFITSFSLRYALPPYAFELDRIAFAITVIFCFFRLFRFWYVLPSLGPRAIAIQMMLTELLKFLLVLVVFVVSFGIAFQAILSPNQKPSVTTIVNIVWRPFWQMFGELFLDDEAGGMGRGVSDISCAARVAKMHQEEAEYNNAIYLNNTTDVYCVQWAAPILLGVYLLIANVLLLNLLVAIFSQAYEEVKEMSQTVFKFNLYSLTQECYYLTAFPPPFSLVERLVQFIWLITCYLKRDKFEPLDEHVEDHFRLNMSSVSEKLQRVACENMPRYSAS